MLYIYGIYISFLTYLIYQSWHKSALKIDAVFFPNRAEILEIFYQYMLIILNRLYMLKSIMDIKMY